MNKIQRTLYAQLKAGDPKLIALFEQFVKNMGHTQMEAKQIVESIVRDDKHMLTENASLADMSKFEDE